MSDQPTNPSLLRGVKRLYAGILDGDQLSVERLRSVSAQAKEGDMAALAALNTVAIVNYETQYPRQWAKAGGMLARIQQGDPEAIAWAAHVQKKAKEGAEPWRRILGMLNAQRDKGIASAWAAPAVSGENDNTRTRNVTSMTLGSYYRAVAQGNARAAAVVGAADSVQSTRRFLALTPDVEQKLITMMLRGAASRPVQEDPTGLSNVTLPTTSTSTATPAGPKTASLSDLMGVYTASAAPKPATPAEVEAFKAQHNDMGSRFNAGQMLAANMANFGALRTAKTQGQDWDIGFYNGLIICLGNTAYGPGQDAARNQMFGDIPNEPMRGDLRNRGFQEARAAMYEYGLARKPFYLPTTVKSLGRVKTTGTTAPSFTGPQAICDAAASALARKSPAAPSLVAQCSALRRQNIMNGVYVADNLTTNDPAYRVALTDAGQAVIDKNPKMAQFRATLPASQQRGFTMAMGARAGKVDPKFIDFVTPGLAVDPELLKGFLDGMRM